MICFTLLLFQTHLTLVYEEGGDLQLIVSKFFVVVTAFCFSEVVFLNS